MESSTSGTSGTSGASIIGNIEPAASNAAKAAVASSNVGLKSGKKYIIIAVILVLIIGILVVLSQTGKLSAFSGGAKNSSSGFNVENAVSKFMQRQQSLLG